jgi:sugar transferase (PEP-CTERM system associated)
MGYAVVGLVPERARAHAGTRPGRAEERTATLRPRLLGSAALSEPAPAAPEVSAASYALLPPEFEPEPEGDAPALAPEAAGSLAEIVERERVDVIAVALEDRRASLPVEDLLACRLSGVTVCEQESLYERIAGKIAVDALRPSYLIFNEGFARSPWSDLVKRAFDLLLSLVLFALTWPLMLAAALCVRLDSPGPVLFRQERVGRDGRVFTLLKFRSMRADAEQATGPVWATRDDPRITRVGRWLRRTRLDELPQLVNVLAGDMSIVGPRPERPNFVEELSARIPYFRQRHIVKPGLTGWAQINYRYGSTFEDAVEKLQYDLYYIKNRSVLFDLSILFNTVKIVLLRKGT